MRWTAANTGPPGTIEMHLHNIFRSLQTTEPYLARWPFPIDTTSHSVTADKRDLRMEYRSLRRRSFAQADEVTERR